MIDFAGVSKRFTAPLGGVDLTAIDDVTMVGPLGPAVVVGDGALCFAAGHYVFVRRARAGA